MLENFKSYFSFNNDDKGFTKRQKAGIKLILWLIFIGAVSTYLALNMPEESDIELENHKEVKEISDGKTILNRFLSNHSSYSFSYNINKSDINGSSLITYNGTYSDSKNMLSTISNNEEIEYMYEDEKLYIFNGTEYILTEDNTLNGIDYKYLKIENYLNYLNSSTLEYKKNYSSGDYEFMYNIPVKSVLTDYEGIDNFNLLIRYGTETRINIDYTNLFKIIDSNINSINIELVLSEIN